MINDITQQIIVHVIEVFKYSKKKLREIFELYNRIMNNDKQDLPY